MRTPYLWDKSHIFWNYGSEGSRSNSWWVHQLFNELRVIPLFWIRFWIRLSLPFCNSAPQATPLNRQPHPGRDSALE